MSLTLNKRGLETFFSNGTPPIQKQSVSVFQRYQGVPIADAQVSEIVERGIAQPQAEGVITWGIPHIPRLKPDRARTREGITA